MPNKQNSASTIVMEIKLPSVSVGVNTHCVKWIVLNTLSAINSVPKHKNQRCSKHPAKTHGLGLLSANGIARVFYPIIIGVVSRGSGSFSSVLVQLVSGAVTSTA